MAIPSGPLPGSGVGATPMHEPVAPGAVVVAENAVVQQPSFFSFHQHTPLFFDFYQLVEGTAKLGAFVLQSMDKSAAAAFLMFSDSSKQAVELLRHGYGLLVSLDLVANGVSARGILWRKALFYLFYPSSQILDASITSNGANTMINSWVHPLEYIGRIVGILKVDEEIRSLNVRVHNLQNINPLHVIKIVGLCAQGIWLVLPFIIPQYAMMKNISLGFRSLEALCSLIHHFMSPIQIAGNDPARNAQGNASVI